LSKHQWVAASCPRRITRREACSAAWEAALSSDRPVVLEAYTDPNGPNLRPHITLEQARSFISSIASGEVDASGFIKQTLKDVAEHWIPHKDREPKR
jgi:pyruvate dehydrogenase (quinone)